MNNCTWCGDEMDEGLWHTHRCKEDSDTSLQLDKREIEIAEMALAVFLSNLMFDGEEAYEGITEEEVIALQIKLFRANHPKENHA